MKRTLLVLGIMACAVRAHAGSDFDGNTFINPAIWRSSVTSTADTAATITTQPVTFHGVVIASAASTTGFFIAYDINNTVLTSSVPLNVTGSYFFDIKPSTAGFKYTTTIPSNGGVTILWQYLYRHDAGK